MPIRRSAVRRGRHVGINDAGRTTRAAELHEVEREEPLATRVLGRDMKDFKMEGVLLAVVEVQERGGRPADLHGARTTPSATIMKIKFRDRRGRRGRYRRGPSANLSDCSRGRSPRCRGAPHRSSFFSGVQDVDRDRENDRRILLGGDSRSNVCDSAAQRRGIPPRSPPPTLSS